MAWLYVPGLADSNLACPLPSPTTEVSVTSRGKVLSRPYSWSGWRKKQWPMRLFGTILQPSMATCFAESWISSLRDSRVSPTALPGNKADGTTRDATTLSLTHSGSSRSVPPPWCSSKMYQPGLLEGIFDQSGNDYQSWATRLRQEYSARRELAQATDESDVLSWPTPAVASSRQGTNQPDGRRGQTLLGASMGQKWPTPAAQNYKSGKTSQEYQDEKSRPLSVVAENWPTPRACSGERSSGMNRTELVDAWNTPTANDDRQREGNATGNRLNYPGLFRQAQGITTDGVSLRNILSDCYPQCPRLRLTLNPVFVTWLMGFPIGWINFEALETPWFHWLQRMRSELSRLLRGSGLEVE